MGITRVTPPERKYGNKNSRHAVLDCRDCGDGVQYRWQFSDHGLDPDLDQESHWQRRAREAEACQEQGTHDEGPGWWAVNTTMSDE